VDEARDQELVRKLRRDLDEAKRRLSEKDTSYAEVCKERDNAKMERNDEFIKHAKELESERTSRRVLQTEADKLKFKVKCLEDDVHKESLKAERKAQEALACLKDKTSLLSTLKEKELMIDSLRRQVSQIKEDLHQRETELDAQARRVTTEDKHMQLLDRKEKSRLQREMENVERHYQEED
jgi:hypothetical protein